MAKIKTYQAIFTIITTVDMTFEAKNQDDAEDYIQECIDGGGHDIINTFEDQGGMNEEIEVDGPLEIPKPKKKARSKK